MRQSIVSELVKLLPLILAVAVALAVIVYTAPRCPGAAPTYVGGLLMGGCKDDSKTRIKPWG